MTSWINLILEAPIGKTKEDFPHTVAVNTKSMDYNYSNVDISGMISNEYKTLTMKHNSYDVTPVHRNKA